MKFVFHLLILFSSVSAFAGIVEKRQDQRILLTEPNCKIAADDVKALRAWTLTSNSQAKCEAAAGVSTGDRCEVDITRCVPEHVAKYQGVDSATGGPNCWNLVLVMKGILPNLRYSSDAEMTFYMRPPLCQQVGDKDKRAGDIGAVRYEKKEEIHGFIYVNDKLAYSKNGMTGPYQLQSLDNVLDLYIEGARTDVSYFRCDSMSEYLKKNPDIPRKLLETYDQLGNFENCLERFVVSNEPLSNEAKSSIIDTGKALAEYLVEQRKSGKNLNEKETFVIASLQLRLDSIAEQLSYTTQKDIGKEVHHLEDLINQEQKSLKGLNL
jgi:hypothetical protein